MTETIHVLHIVFDLDGGGLESVIAAMARAAPSHRLRVSVMTLSGRTGRVGEGLKGVVDRLEVVRPRRGWSMLSAPAISAAIRRISPDVVHAHSGAWYKTVRLARDAGVPAIVYTEHGRAHWDPWLMVKLDRQAARRTDNVVAVSDPLAGYLERRLRVDPRKIRMIPNGVDTDRFRPGPPPPDLREELGLPSNALVVGSVGRLEAVKRYDLLLSAFSRVRVDPARVGQRLYLLLCGDGTERHRLQEQATRAGIGDRVRFLGWRQDTASFYRLLDVFALASSSEGTSISLLEALSTGVAPVVTDVGGNAAVLGPGLAGQLVPSGSEDELAQRLEVLLADERRRRELGAIARQRVLDDHGLDRMVERYLELYREAGAGAAVPRSGGA